MFVYNKNKPQVLIENAINNLMQKKRKKCQSYVHVGIA